MSLLRKVIASTQLWFRYRGLASQKKVIYALTPTPGLRNIGDHAQAVAIHAWIKKHFPGLPVVEADKNECVHAITSLKRLVGSDDVVLLHSGGNLGDRGIWSETGRRNIIKAFPDQQIVSLPQTIYFSDTPTGRAEQANSQQIYGSHRHLTVIGRDPRSGELAKELFPSARTFCIPDFVLSLPPQPGKSVNRTSPRVLLCLRLDVESVFDAAGRQSVADSLPFETDFFDTTIAEKIPRSARESWLRDTLDRFGRYDAVVTDRFHGLIFSVLTKRPTVVLSTVDHKLTSAFHWFDAVSFVQFAEGPEHVSNILEEVLKSEDFSAPDWNKLYFDRILERADGSAEIA